MPHGVSEQVSVCGVPSLRNLFGIVQGHLDTKPGGLREYSLKDLLLAMFFSTRPSYPTGEKGSSLRIMQTAGKLVTRSSEELNSFGVSAPKSSHIQYL